MKEKGQNDHTRTAAVADAREDGFPLKTADIVENNGLEGTHFGTTTEDRGPRYSWNGFEPVRMITLKQILRPALSGPILFKIQNVERPRSGSFFALSMLVSY